MKKHLNVAIIEDDAKAREILRAILSSIDDGIKIIGEADSVGKGIDLIESTKPDLIFLDIELKDGTGFELLDKIADINFEVVFTTGYDQYAIKAFQCCALHYILKPVDEKEIKDAVNRFWNVQKPSSFPSAEHIDVLLNNLKPTQQKKIAIRESSSVQFIKIQSIVRCKAEGNYTHIYLVDGTKILSAKNLKEYDNMLDSDGFYRVHNSHLINLALVKKYKSGRGGNVVMEDGSEVEVAVRKKEELLKRLESF